jgi:glycogen(starch) synthase
MTPTPNIAIFASAFHPSLGGVEELVRQLAHAYRKRGVQTIVFTNRWPRSLPKHEIYEGIEIYRLPMRFPQGSTKANLTYLLSRNAILHEIIAILRQHNTQILHVQCVSSNGYYALEASRALKLPLVVTAQGERTMDADRIFEKSKFLNCTLRLLLDEADHITACSHDTLKDLEQYRGTPFSTRGQVVYNGIELDDFKNATPYSHPRPYILGIGRHVPQKGFDVLLKAFAQAKLPNTDLILAGDGSEHEALRQLTAKLSLSDRVIFWGRADRTITPQLFKGCDFFVLPSRQEPFGIVNIEAMAAGKAIVATRVGGVPEIIVHDQNGLLVPADDVDALAKAIVNVGTDAVLKNRLANCGRERVEQFSWSSIASQYWNIYDEVLTEDAAQTAL